MSKQRKAGQGEREVTTTEFPLADELPDESQDETAIVIADSQQVFWSPAVTEALAGICAAVKSAMKLTMGPRLPAFSGAVVGRGLDDDYQGRPRRTIAAVSCDGSKVLAVIRHQYGLDQVFSAIDDGSIVPGSILCVRFFGYDMIAKGEGTSAVQRTVARLQWDVYRSDDLPDGCDARIVEAVNYARELAAANTKIL